MARRIEREVARNGGWLSVLEPVVSDNSAEDTRGRNNSKSPHRLFAISTRVRAFLAKLEESSGPTQVGGVDGHQRSLEAWADYKLGLLADAHKVVMSFLNNFLPSESTQTEADGPSMVYSSEQETCRLMPKRPTFEEHCFDKVSSYLGKENCTVKVHSRVPSRSLMNP